MSSQTSSDDRQMNNKYFNRRTLLQSLSAGAAVGLAGCNSGDNDEEGGGDGGGSEGDGSSNQNLGERVPSPVVLEYWANFGGASQIMESASPIIKDGFEEAFDHSLEIKPKELISQINDTSDDLRTHHIGFWFHTNTPDRLDPQEMTRRYSADWAGGTGRANPNNYANCQHTEAARQQAVAQNEEERQSLVTEAQSVMSNDAQSVPLFPNVILGAYHPDQLEVNGIGSSGLTRTNPYIYIQSEPQTEDNTIITNANPVQMQTTNFPILSASAPLGVWNHLVHSTLTEYDADNELVNVLAREYEVEDNGKVITVELRDAEFHNGDSVTSEDVKFTYEHLANNASAYPQVTEPPYDSIEIIDEKTTQFNFTESFLPLISKVWPRWGIFHRDTWVDGGATENPEEFEFSPAVGSGPFELANFKADSSMELVPFDGHPVHSPDHNIFFQAYQDQQSIAQAFDAKELRLMVEASPGTINNLRQNSNNAEIDVSSGFVPYVLYPQYPIAPTKLSSFNKALGAAVNRQRMIDVALFGSGEPVLHSCPILESHTYYPPEDQLHQFTDDPTGDIQGAQQVLQEAGWGWDDNGNLRYPSDADTSDQWPKGETPSPEDFPCLDK